jgi:hypothetical protein
VGQVGSGAGRGQWLQEQLDANKLIVTDQIVEITACYTLSLILASKPDEAGVFRARALEQVKRLVAELDTNADGQGDYAIDCTAAGR